MVELGDHLHRVGHQADLLLRLPQRGAAHVLPDEGLAARERDLTSV